MEEKLINRLESAVTRLEVLADGGLGHGGGAGGGDFGASDASIMAFDDLISDHVSTLMRSAENIGGQVFDVSRIVQEAFNVQRELLVEIKQTQKPDKAGMVEFLRPLNEVIGKVSAMTEGKRSDFFNHLKTACDALNALVWIAYTGKDCGMSMPIAHVEDSWQMAEFYSNKILVEYKNKDANHGEWVKAMKELFVPGLRDFVKKHYPMGPVWNTSGKKVTNASVKAPAPAPPQAPPSNHFSSENAKATSSNPTSGMSAIFNEISSGNVTSGLRKVTDDMKSKNRPDKTGAISLSQKVEKQTRTTESANKTLPPKLELQMGRKWVVEHQLGQDSLVIDDCDAKQTVYIFGCKNSVLQIHGKVNNITVDKCTKMGVVFSDLVAACEIVNCNDVKVQCQGTAPTISVDNTSGCEIYLSKYSLETSMTTAKSSEINVMVAGSESPGDWVEHPLPQQYMHTYKDGQFQTIPVSHSGA